MVAEWQKAAVLELKNQNVHTIFVAVVPGELKDKRDSIILKKIDFRFSNYSKQAKAYSSTDVFLQKYKIAKADLNSKVDLIIDFTNHNKKPQGLTKILKPEINEDEWQKSPLRKEKKTEIRLLQYEKGDWLVENTLKFCTEKGIYNNRDKALFYFAYLIQKSINGVSAVPQNIASKQYRSSLAFHYFSLLREMANRKINKNKLNWKVALKINGEFRFIGRQEKLFWADPFVVKIGDENWVFIEEYNYVRKKGEIAVFHLDGTYTVKRKHTVIAEKEHLSFPNVFLFENDFYMMLEKSESCRLDIYKAEEMPFKWKYYKTILHDMKVVDPSWLFHNGMYYLFFNKVENHEYENNERLYIYYSEDLLSSNWKPHPKNPVIVDKLGARNAGAFIQKENDIFACRRTAPIATVRK